MTENQSKQFFEAFRTKQLIRFERSFGGGPIEGYVLDIGPVFCLIAVLDGGSMMMFDGFQCVRLADIRKLQVPCPHAAFCEAALKKRGGRKPRKSAVKLESLAKLLESAGRYFPMVTIHRERVSDGCEIGKVLGVQKNKVLLLEIDPDAHWAKDGTAYALREITRVDFGDGYAEALHLVGGDAPV